MITYRQQDRLNKAEYKAVLDVVASNVANLQARAKQDLWEI